ncbi:MAG: hypothetical protein LBO03_09050 [Acidaminococcales bacterium]|nr:hypothetical protein [Acidaminococcales bacterium]
MQISWRIAAASSNGLEINRHFGQASSFFIFDLKPGGAYELAEERAFNQFCSDCGHENLSERMDIFADCGALLAAKVGPGARAMLEAAGLLVFEQEGRIDQNLRRLAKYLALRQTGKQQ